MSLYTRLIDQESHRHREVLDRIHYMQSAILSAERICKRLSFMGLQAKVEATEHAIPFLHLPMAIDLLPELDSALADAGQKIGRQIVANGPSRYMVLPYADEFNQPGLEILISEI